MEDNLGVMEDDLGMMEDYSYLGVMEDELGRMEDGPGSDGRGHDMGMMEDDLFLMEDNLLICCFQIYGTIQPGDDIFPSRMSPIGPASFGSHFDSFEATDLNFFVQVQLYSRQLEIF